MVNVTYLLGAGASANIIPVVGDMHRRISEINGELKVLQSSEINQYNKNRYANLPANLKDENKTLKEIISDLDWLINESQHYYTIDTLAKKYYLKNDRISYERLKKSLIIYLTFEQFIFLPSNTDTEYKFVKNRVDKRYDNFIATLASYSKSGLMLNNNVKILSWNYDIQIELSLKRFTEKNIDQIKKNYQIFPGLNSHDSKNDVTDTNKFSVRKLNGSAIFSTGQKYGDDDIIFDKKYPDSFSNDELIGLLIEEISKFDFNDNVSARFFNFAWEGADEFKNDFSGRRHEGYRDNILEAEKIARETEILVVIGYSFPIFNREIDNKLFDKMPKLRKVYIQDKNPERIKSTMMNAFRVLQDKMLIPEPTPFPSEMTLVKRDTKYTEESIVSILLESFTDQFVIPYELSIS